MKKNLLILIACLGIFSTRISASHLMGGQIIATQLSGLDYKITMTLYRDVTGIPIALTATFNIDGMGATSTVTANYTGPINLYNAVEVYTYEANYTFPTAGHYQIYWEECCRNAAILNMAAPGGESLYLMTEVEVYAAANNSTPTFLNPPTTIAQKNQAWQYNPLPFDADGDSLAWLIEIPLGASGAIVAGFTPPHADPLGPFTLNALTGELTWWPDSNGHWEASFRVEEYRAGVKIGEIRRDMQIIVMDDTTNYQSPVINNGSWPIDQLGNFAMNIAPGTPFNLTVTATDQDNDPLTLSVAGEPLLLTTAPAQWVAINNGPGYASGTFSWTPSSSNLRAQPYIVVFRTTEQHNQNYFNNDETLLLYVDANASISNLENTFNSSLYPNPSNGTWNLSFVLDKSSDVSIEVIDLAGKMVESNSYEKLSAGANVIRNSKSNLAPGYYIVNLYVDGTRVYSNPLTVK